MTRDPSPTSAHRIGQILSEHGHLTEEQLEQALDEQARQGEPDVRVLLGEVCTRHGWCSMADVAGALRLQQEAVFHDTTLGHLLVAQGHLSLESLDEALAEQDELRVPLGELLIAVGLCTPEQVHDALDLQTRRRNAALRHLTAAAFQTYNVTEIIVNQELDEILREVGACTCDECRANALAIALNSLPARYVSNRRMLLLYVERFRAESLEPIRERLRVAAQHVKDHPKGARHIRPLPRPLDTRAQGGQPLDARRINCHVHLCQGDVEALFGPGHALTPWQEGSQPGYFVARETVDVVGPKGAIEKVRVIGPPVNRTRVEATGPDLFRLGQPAQSGERGPVTLRGPKGQITGEPALARVTEHIHCSPVDAAALGVRDGQPVSVRVHGPRSRILEAVPVRILKDAHLELHVPADDVAAEGAADTVGAEILLTHDSQG